MFLGGRFSPEEIIAYGGIPEASAKDMCSSAHVQAQANADDTQMARAQKRAQERDDLELPGTSSPISKFTIASFSDEVVVDRAKKLGV